jgi:hypothetical protein
MVALRSDSSPMNRPVTIAMTNALTVPSVVAIRNGGLFNSANGVCDMMPIIQARPDSGSPLVLPQAKPMKIRPK